VRKHFISVFIILGAKAIHPAIGFHKTRHSFNRDLSGPVPPCCVIMC
jgi:hypothetical protein